MRRRLHGEKRLRLLGGKRRLRRERLNWRESRYQVVVEGFPEDAREDLSLGTHVLVVYELLLLREVLGERLIVPNQLRPRLF